MFLSLFQKSSAQVQNTKDSLIFLPRLSNPLWFLNVSVIHLDDLTLIGFKCFSDRSR